jgi:hypothetical protein
MKTLFAEIVEKENLVEPFILFIPEKTRPLGADNKIIFSGMKLGAVVTAPRNFIAHCTRQRFIFNFCETDRTSHFPDTKKWVAMCFDRALLWDSLAALFSIYGCLTFTKH